MQPSAEKLRSAGALQAAPLVTSLRGACNSQIRDSTVECEDFNCEKNEMFVGIKCDADAQWHTRQIHMHNVAKATIPRACRNKFDENGHKNRKVRT